METTALLQAASHITLRSLLPSSLLWFCSFLLFSFRTSADSKVCYMWKRNSFDLQALCWNSSSMFMKLNNHPKELLHIRINILAAPLFSAMKWKKNQLYFPDKTSTFSAEMQAHLLPDFFYLMEEEEMRFGSPALPAGRFGLQPPQRLFCSLTHFRKVTEEKWSCAVSPFAFEAVRPCGATSRRVSGRSCERQPAGVELRSPRKNYPASLRSFLSFPASIQS